MVNLKKIQENWKKFQSFQEIKQFLRKSLTFKKLSREISNNTHFTQNLPWKILNFFEIIKITFFRYKFFSGNFVLKNWETNKWKCRSLTKKQFPVLTPKIPSLSRPVKKCRQTKSLLCSSFALNMNLFPAQDEAKNKKSFI